jgi:hypothetical protein
MAYFDYRIIACVGQKPNVCYAFLRGECNRGNACRFSHPMDETQGYAMPYQMPPAQYRPNPGFCFAFQRGECYRGDACKYSHVGGDFMSYGNGYQQPSRKPCFAFQQGECVHGESCRFAHITADGRMMPGFPQQRPSRKPCFAFLNTGACERGEACRFSHDDGSMMPPMSMGAPMGGMMGGGYGMPPPNSMSSHNPPVCFAFQRGQCSRGESCRFAHIGAPMVGMVGGVEPMGGVDPMGGIAPVGVGVPIPSTAEATSGAYDANPDNYSY